MSGTYARSPNPNQEQDVAPTDELEIISMIKPLFPKQHQQWHDDQNQNQNQGEGTKFCFYSDDAQCFGQSQGQDYQDPCQEGQGECHCHYIADSVRNSQKSKFKQESMESMNWMNFEGTRHGLQVNQSQGSRSRAHGSTKSSRTILKISPATHSIAIPHLSTSDLNILSQVKSKSNSKAEAEAAGNSNSNPALQKTTALAWAMLTPSSHKNYQQKIEVRQDTGQVGDQNQTTNGIGDFEFAGKKENKEKGKGGGAEGKIISVSSELLLTKLKSLDSVESSDSHKKDTMALSIKSSGSSQYLSCCAFEFESSDSVSGSGSDFGNCQNLLNTGSSSNSRKLQRSSSLQFPASSSSISLQKISNKRLNLRSASITGDSAASNKIGSDSKSNAIQMKVKVSGRGRAEKNLNSSSDFINVLTCARNGGKPKVKRHSRR